MASGQLNVLAARIEEQRPHDDGVEVRVRRRGTSAMETMRVARVINCSGPQIDYARCEIEFVRNLRAQDFPRPDLLGLGLDVDDRCAVLVRPGHSSERLFAVEPPTRGTFWEITAVPKFAGSVRSSPST